MITSASRTLLLVDDDPTVRMILARQVGLLGHACEVAVDGVEGFDLWRSGRFAAVITDCEMPRMDGYELARRIREAESAAGFGRSVIAAHTTHAIPAEIAKCIAAGMDTHLPKPVDLDRLRVELRGWGMPSLPGADRGVEPRDASPLPAGEAIDPAVLAEICGNDPSRVRDYLSRFRGFYGVDAQALEKAVAILDMQELAHICHRMKGAGRIIGALALAAACESVEREANAQASFARIAPGIAALRFELERLDRRLDELCRPAERPLAASA
jgi:CheY-like chemotaxis protein